ncbi:MAG: hypothetical protein Q4G45_03805 [Actinomycetia bacterium]|nr:hypothetical protein [Actinomycetes bacterium]
MTDSADITPILEELAAGRIDAAEASRRIDHLRNQPDPVRFEQPPTPTPQEASGEWRSYARESFREEPERPRKRRAPGTNGVDRISVRAVGRRVRIVGDPAVATAAAEGPHLLRRNGSVLEVASDGEVGPSLDGFSLLRPPRSLDDLRSLGLGKELLLRVNPAIVLDVELTAGTLHAEDVPYLGKVRVTAGSAVLDGVAEASDVLVQAGQVSLSGSITSGRSRMRCESGSMTIALDDDSHVLVKADTQLGRVSWPGRHAEGADEVVMGNGSARLDISVVMGYATVRLGKTESPEPQDPS